MRWGYVSTSGGLGWVGLVRHEGRDGVGKKKQKFLLCARFPRVPCRDAWYCTCNTQNRGGKKKPLDAKKKNKRKGKEGRRRREESTARGEVLAARHALTLTSILLDFHRVLRMLILMRTTCRPRAPATRSRSTTWRRPYRPGANRGGAMGMGMGKGMGIIISQDHHGVPTLSASRHCQRQRQRDGERICRCGRGRQGRERGERKGRWGR